MKQATSFDGEHYVIALPFKPFYKLFHGNYTWLKHRYSIAKPKLDKDEELKQEYNQVFDNYLKGDIIKKVDDDDYEGLKKPWLAPLVSCKCDKETAKMRARFDASAKYGNELSR